MLATVQGGSLGRWFEELCRIRVGRLRDVTTQGGTRLLPGDLPASGGVYAFWWTGASDLLEPPNCNRRISLVGPGGRRVLLEIDDDWLGLGAPDFTRAALAYQNAVKRTWRHPRTCSGLGFV